MRGGEPLEAPCCRRCAERPGQVTSLLICFIICQAGGEGLLWQPRWCVRLSREKDEKGL